MSGNQILETSSIKICMKAKRSNPDLITLGLAISALSLQPGETRTCEELAFFCQAAGAHCTRQNISQMEQRALRKCRLFLYRQKDLDAELRASLEKIFKT